MMMPRALPKLTERFTILQAIVPLVLTCLSAPQVAQAQPGDADDPVVDAVTFEAAYTADYLANTRGGFSQDEAYLDNLDLVLTVDGDKAFGWRGATLVASALYNNRTTFSDRIVGDSQVLSNIDTDGSLRLYEIWLEQGFGRVQVKAGLVDLNSEFDVNETGALFIGSSIGIGPDFSQIGENGPSIFPVTGLAAITKTALSPSIKLRAGIFEGVPGSVEHPRRTVLRIDGSEGYLLVGELEFNPWKESRIALGARRLSGRDASPANPSLPGRDAQFGAYALVEGPIARLGTGALRGFARYGYADPSSHDIGNSIGAGLVYAGPLLVGKDSSEQLGLSVGAIRNTDRFMLDRAGSGTPADRWETSFELSYRIQAASWLTVQPNVHYVVNPGMDPELGDALVVGLRMELSWQKGF